MIIILISVFSLTAYARPIGAGSGYDLSLNLPPISIVDRVTVVLSPETAFMAGDKPVWTLMPLITFIHRDSITAVFVAGSGAEAEKIDFWGYPVYVNVDQEENLPWMNDSVIAFMKELADPIYNFMSDDNISTDDLEARNYLYADVSALVLSYFVRGITKNQLDLYLLTSRDSSNRLFVNGMEFGIRPEPFFGLRIRVREDNSSASNNYGVEFHLYPTDNISIKVLHDDNSTEYHTGVEFNLIF